MSPTTLRRRRTLRVRQPKRHRLSQRFRAGQPRRRLLTILVVTIAILAAVLVRVGLLQTVQGGALRSAATEQRTRERPLRAQRGTIFDRNGEELALSVPAATVAVNPQQVTDPAGTAAVLADVLDLDGARQAELLEEMAAAGDSGFLYVARQVDTVPGDRLAELDLTGVTVYREDRRVLPGGDTARSVIGRTDTDGKGTAGLERQYDNVLAGSSGMETIEMAPGGRSIAGSERVTRDPIPGNDLVVTIDRSIQYAAEQALLKRVSELGARGAQAVVMNSTSGEIYAMASVRTDDGVYEITSSNDSAVDAYEPGSVGKVITMAAALNERTVTPDTIFTVPWQKVYTRNGERLSDASSHPTQPMTVAEILVKSSNIGTITVSETIGLERQYQYMQAFGLGERTALNFPGENPGILKPWQDLIGLEKFTVAYWQGVAASPIQLIAAVNTIANDGTYVSPKLVRSTVDRSGELRDMPPAATRQVVRPEVAETMQQMMRRVVCEGTATGAQVAGLSIAGKTGTGYIAQPNGGYLREDGTKAYYASFVGFFPAEDPQVTILVSIDEPPADSADRFGGTAAAPVFRELAPTMVRELAIELPLGSTGCTE